MGRFRRRAVVHRPRDRRRGLGDDRRRRPASTGLASFVAPYPTFVRDLVLLAIAVGAVAANVLNIYSGSMSFTTLGIQDPVAHRAARWSRACSASPASSSRPIGLNDIGKYENFLLIIAYWIGPWLAVFFVDQLHQPRQPRRRALRPQAHELGRSDRDGGRHGGVDPAVQQPDEVHRATSRSTTPSVGDLTFEVGFVVAAVVYYVLYKAGLGAEEDRRRCRTDVTAVGRRPALARRRDRRGPHRSRRGWHPDRCRARRRRAAARRRPQPPGAARQRDPSRRDQRARERRPAAGERLPAVDDVHDAVAVRHVLAARSCSTASRGS